MPAWYLLANHETATLDDLRRGLAEMRRSGQQEQDGGPAHLIKVECRLLLVIRTAKKQKTGLRLSAKALDLRHLAS